MHLKEILSSLDDGNYQKKIKRAFMPFTDAVSVDGKEKEALTILLNLSFEPKKCKDWTKVERAKNYFYDEKNINQAIKEVSFYHTHNLKHPDSRIKNPRIIAASHFKTTFNPELLGWSHSAATYMHTIWLLNTFIWQGKETNIFTQIKRHDPKWLKLLSDFGLSESKIELFVEEFSKLGTENILPDEVSPFSKQVRFLLGDDYVAITPVVSHSFLVDLERLYRTSKHSLHFITLALKRPENISSLGSSLGGYFHLLHYPLNISIDTKKTLFHSKISNGKHFDDSQLTNKHICEILNRLVGIDQLTTQKKQKRARKHQLKWLRKYIAYWVLPLIELKDRDESEINEHIESCQDEVIQNFLVCELHELPSFRKNLQNRIDQVFQNNKYTQKFAYHPNLTKAIQSQLKWLLNQLAKQQETTTSSNSQYIYLSSMRATDVNANSCPYLVGAPSFIGIWGFMHHFQRTLNEHSGSQEKIRFTKFAIFIKNETLHKTTKLAEPCARKKTKKDKQDSPYKQLLSPTQYLSDLEFDLVIEVQTTKPIALNETRLKTSIPTNFLGGTLFPPSIKQDDKWLSIFTEKSALFNKIQGLPSYGAWLSPSEIQISCLNDIEASIEEDPSLLPITNGFYLLEKLKQRDGSVSNKHAFSENSLSMAKKINPIDFRFLRMHYFFERAFWSYKQTSNSITVGLAKGINHGSV